MARKLVVSQEFTALTYSLDTTKNAILLMALIKAQRVLRVTGGYA